MKILSFDVGIKNLAYCIMSVENDKYKIFKWEIINLTHDYVKLKKNNVNIDVEFIMHYKKLKINDLKDCMKKIGLGTEDGKKKKDLVLMCDEYLKKNKLNNLTKCKNISLFDLGKILYNNLDELMNIGMFNDIDEVIIENQPVLKNPTMKSIQILIFGYFINLTNRNKNLISNIKLISARNKLKVYNGPIIKDNYKIKNKYNLTKKLAIDYCKYMIDDQKDFLIFFNNHPKKDDLADCYLQGAYYLCQNKKKKKKSNQSSIHTYFK